jgi:hypothetical protein
MASLDSLVERVNINGQSVGNNSFLEQSDREYHQTHHQISRDRFAEQWLLKLRHHLLEVNDRTGD